MSGGIKARSMVCFRADGSIIDRREVGYAFGNRARQRVIDSKALDDARRDLADLHHVRYEGDGPRYEMPASSRGESL